MREHPRVKTSAGEKRLPQKAAEVHTTRESGRASAAPKRRDHQTRELPPLKLLYVGKRVEHCHEPMRQLVPPVAGA
jgi:hypothetical protein